MASYGALGRYIIYRCIVGSRAYGLDTPASDTDRRGFYLPPASMHWSLQGLPEQLEDDAAQECYWELQKFLTLALKSNPTVLECLYTPLVESAAPVAQELLQNRHRFLSRQVYETYCGYVRSQFKLISTGFAKTGTFKRKHAMHLIRLLLCGISALRNGEIAVQVTPEQNAPLMAIRQGQMAWDEIEAWQRRLQREFDEALRHTRLPEYPDRDWADAYLIRARRSAVTESEGIS